MVNNNREIAAAWSNGKLVQGQVIKHRHMRATMPEEETKLGYKVRAHERVEIDLGKDEKGRPTTLDVAAERILIKPA